MFDFIWAWPIFIMQLAWVILFWGLILGGIYIYAGILFEKLKDRKKQHNDLNKPEDYI